MVQMTRSSVVSERLPCFEANKVRSLLTTLGIIIGVASVTAVIAILTGMKNQILTEFETFGANKIFIFPDRPDDAPRNKYPWRRTR